MDMPSREAIEMIFLPRLKALFKNIEMKYIDDEEFSYYEICYNKENDGFITIDNEALEISLDYAFFRFVYAAEDLIAYRVIGTSYEIKGLDTLFDDAVCFIQTNLVGCSLEMQYTHSGNRLIRYELYKTADNGKELLYTYKYTSLPDLFFKARVKTRLTVLE